VPPIPLAFDWCQRYTDWGGENRQSMPAFTPDWEHTGKVSARQSHSFNGIFHLMWANKYFRFGPVFAFLFFGLAQPYIFRYFIYKPRRFAEKSTSKLPIDNQSKKAFPNGILRHTLPAVCFACSWVSALFLFSLQHQKKKELFFLLAKCWVLYLLLYDLTAMNCQQIN